MPEMNRTERRHYPKIIEMLAAHADKDKVVPWDSGKAAKLIRTIVGHDITPATARNIIMDFGYKLKDFRGKYTRESVIQDLLKRVEALEDAITQG